MPETNKTETLISTIDPDLHVACRAILHVLRAKETRMLSALEVSDRAGLTSSVTRAALLAPTDAGSMMHYPEVAGRDYSFWSGTAMLDEVLEELHPCPSDRLKQAKDLAKQAIDSMGDTAKPDRDAVAIGYFLRIIALADR